MNGNEANVAVTLSADLLRTMRREARRLGVPIEWLVASLVVDTVEGPNGAPGGVAA